MPSLVAMMTKPSAKPYPDVVIPKDYALAHFPRKNQTIKLQLPEQSKKWYCEFHVKSNGGHCSLYDCGFVRDNHLLEGDLCVFQPMPNCKGRTFKVIVHLFRKATIDHPSSENISKRGLPSTKNTPTLCIKEEPKDDEETFSSGYDEHRISKKDPYMMSLGARLTQGQKKKVLEKVGAIASDLHIYVAVMNKTNVRRSLTFATKYCDTYLRKGSRSLVFQAEGKIQQWHGGLHVTDRALRIRGGWTSFARDNNLREGDICLFELMKNKVGLKKMMVYIIRRERC
uniref:TF-B3 domain-containing protein n=1 Tax=Aegilops tauschii subsp. strangulata TaxID=200361 RepID=A0A453HEP3_AEGTS